MSLIRKVELLIPLQKLALISIGILVSFSSFGIEADLKLTCTDKKPFPVAQATYLVTGTVLFMGKPREQKVIDLSAHKDASAYYKDKQLLDERYVISAEGKLANVLVYVFQRSREFHV